MLWRWGEGKAVADTNNPTFREAVGVFARIGVMSFGGPAAQIALMHRVLVDERKWLAEPMFLSALSFCMLLPGPEAMQLATYAGWRLHGVRGGLVAGLLFVAPGAAVVLALAMIYAAYGNLPVVAALFLGIKSAVLVIVIEALLRIARRALKLPEHWVIAALAFAGLFLFGQPFPLIIGAAALFGYFGGGSGGKPTPFDGGAVPLGATIRTVAAWGAVWAAPLLALAALLGPQHVLTQLGWFFSKLAIVTFGGAYAVLAYMAQDVVAQYHWLTPGEMVDGLGLAETTPGPLILVIEFVGYLAAYRAGGMGSGLLGALVTLWATFAPCFLWIFTFAPYLEWINAQARLRSALAAITAAVVGVILNLAVWFAVHVFFARVGVAGVGPLHVLAPEFSSIDGRVAGLSLLSGYLLLWRHWDVPRVLAVAAAGSIIIWGQTLVR